MPLKKGAKGPTVLQLQTDLITLGAKLPKSTRVDGSLDSILGTETILAVARVLNIATTGEGVSDGELAAIRRKLSEKSSSPTPIAQGLFFDEKGLLQATPDSPFVVFHAPTRERGVREGSVPDWVVVHYTACKAAHLSEKHTKLFDWYMKSANYTDEEKAQLRAEVSGRRLPSSLLLCLSAAAEAKRESSWDFCIGDGPVAEYGNKIPIVQCNLDLRGHYTWHAGQPFGEYQRRSPNKPVTNSDGRTVWNGKKFVYPGPTKANRVSFGIECELYGQITPVPGGFRAGTLGVTDRLPGGTIAVNGNTYEKPHALADEARRQLVTLLCQEFGIEASHIEQHRAFDPLRRTDVSPPIDVAELRSQVSATLHA
jgi:hypothetical protein